MFCFAAATITFLRKLKKKIAFVLQRCGILRQFPWKRGHDLRRARGTQQRRPGRADSSAIKTRVAPFGHEAVARPGLPYASPAGEARIAIVGKYVQLEDAYKSLREALLHGGLAHITRPFSNGSSGGNRLRGNRCGTPARHDGILVPGGFGKRGIQGRFTPFNMPVNTKSRSSVFAWECSAPPSNTRATSPE